MDFEGCAALFARHRVEAFGGTFHVPDVDRYPALFSWDSGYHALCLRHLDSELAWHELTTLFRANTLPGGLLSHQRFLPGAREEQRFIEELFGPMFAGEATNPGKSGEIKWNFNKFLVGRHGEMLARFEPKVEPSSPEVKQAIEEALSRP